MMSVIFSWFFNSFRMDGLLQRRLTTEDAEGTESCFFSVSSVLSAVFQNPLRKMIKSPLFSILINRRYTQIHADAGSTNLRSSAFSSGSQLPVSRTKRSPIIPSVLLLLLPLLLLLLLASGTASAGVVYTDHIDVGADTIVARISETYTGNDAEIVERDLAGGRSTYIERAEETLLAWGTSYIVVDCDSSLLEMQRVDVNVTNVSGTFLINSTLEYGVAASLDHGGHSIWIQGHPGITSRTITLPANVEIASVAGIRDPSEIEVNGHATVTGASATRKFLNGTQTTFEYATVVEIRKKPIYTHPMSLPLIVSAEFVLLGAWLWMRRKNR
jgi:hypothetical protein